MSYERGDRVQVLYKKDWIYAAYLNSVDVAHLVRPESPVLPELYIMKDTAIRYPSYDETYRPGQKLVANIEGKLAPVTFVEAVINSFEVVVQVGLNDNMFCIRRSDIQGNKDFPETPTYNDIWFYNLFKRWPTTVELESISVNDLPGSKSLKDIRNTFAQPLETQEVKDLKLNATDFKNQLNEVLADRDRLADELSRISLSIDLDSRWRKLLKYISAEVQPDGNYKFKLSGMMPIDRYTFEHAGTTVANLFTKEIDRTCVTSDNKVVEPTSPIDVKAWDDVPLDTYLRIDQAKVSEATDIWLITEAGQKVFADALAKQSKVSSIGASVISEPISTICTCVDMSQCYNDTSCRYRVKNIKGYMQYMQEATALKAKLEKYEEKLAEYEQIINQLSDLKKKNL